MSQWPAWYVVVRIGREGRDEPWVRIGLHAIGPTTWSRAREIVDAWEQEYGVGTAAATEHPPRTARVVAA